MRTSFIKLISATSIITLLSLSAHADVTDEIEKSFDVNESTLHFALIMLMAQCKYRHGIEPRLKWLLSSLPITKTIEKILS